MTKNILNRLGIIFLVLFALSIFFVNFGYCEEVIFKPGPGLNNGADDGSANAGKDANAGTCGNPGYNGGSSATITALPITTCNTCNTNLFIQFNLDSLPADVTHVYLGFTHLPHTVSCISNCNADFYFYPISQPWNEMTVTINNAPSHGSTAYGPVHITFPNDLGNREYEITDLYKKWKNGTIQNYGIEIASTTSGCNNASVMFYVYSSDEADSSKRPYLRCVLPDTQTWYKDADHDGYSDGTSLQAASRPANYYLASELTATSGDCNDNDAAIHPSATEICGDGKDNNCNGQVDEGCAVTQTWYKDADHDGYSDGTSTQSVSRPANYYLVPELTATSGDCNDNDPAIHPGATEICGDGKDNNCDNQTDEGCAQNIAAPSSLTAQATSSTQITLGWIDNSDNETGFKIEKKTGSCGSTGWTQAATKTANSTTHTISGLKPNTTYSFRVRAYKGSSNSTYSNCAPTKTAASKTPPSPSNLTAASTSSSAVNLTWNDNSTNETGFKIYRKTGSGKWALLTTTKANVKSFSDATASNNASTKSYQYYVAAYNASGNSASSSASTIPYQPTNLTATKGTTINLTWTDKSSNEAGFEIYRKSGSCSSSSAWVKVATLGANTSAWTDTAAASGKTYAYKVKAFTTSGAILSAYGYSMDSACASASGGSSDENTPAKTISGPGGCTIKTPVGGLNGGATITIGETSDSSGLVDEGETLVSKALTLTTSSDTALFGDGTFSVSIPVGKSKFKDAKKLELKVKLTTGVSYPLYGVYDARSGTFTVELSGVKNGWKIAVVEDPAIQIIRVSSGKTPSGIAAAWLTDIDWKTFEWAVVNHTNMSESDIKANILPVMWDTSEKLSKAGFRSPKIYIDPRLSPAARVVHLINNDGNHFIAGAITYADGTWIYTEDQATFSTTALDDEQLSALGQMYVNYDEFLNLNAKYGVSLGNIVIHELFHAVQYGYDVRMPKNHQSLAAYLEGTATPLGQTYQNTGGSVTGPSASVRVLRPNEHARLFQAVDDPSKPLCYTKQDFFAYVTKRYGTNSFAWTDQLFEYMNNWTSGKFGLTADQYRELYRKAMDDTFGALFKKGLSKIFYEYALDRAYEHSSNSVLRPADETEQNGFGQNHLAKPLFQWSNTDTNGLKEFDPQVNASIQFTKIEPLSCYAFYMRLPAQADAATGFPLVFKLEGVQVLSSGDGGIKIVAFLEDANEDMVTNGKIEITDASKPVLIPFKEDAVYLTALIMNCYIENKNVKVTVSAGPYIESATPNPADKGDEVTLHGMSFGAAQGTSKLYFSGDEMSQIKSWSNAQIVFTLPDDAKSGKVKVVVNGEASNEIQLDIGNNSNNEQLSGTFNRTVCIDSDFVTGVCTNNIIGNGSWTLTGTGLSPGISDETQTNIDVPKGTSGRLTITASAILDQYTNEESSIGLRFVTTYHEPKFLGPDSEYSHPNPDEYPAITSISGGGNSITIDYSFPKNTFTSIYLNAGFEIFYDVKAYDKNNNLVEAYTYYNLKYTNSSIYSVYLWAK